MFDRMKKLTRGEVFFTSLQATWIAALEVSILSFFWILNMDSSARIQIRMQTGAEKWQKEGAKVSFTKINFGWSEKPRHIKRFIQHLFNKGVYGWIAWGWEAHFRICRHYVNVLSAPWTNYPISLTRPGLTRAKVSSLAKWIAVGGNRTAIACVAIEVYDHYTTAHAPIHPWQCHVMLKLNKFFVFYKLTKLVACWSISSARTVVMMYKYI